jgi:hypothetical protein
MKLTQEQIENAIQIAIKFKEKEIREEFWNMTDEEVQEFLYINEE